MGAEVKKYTVIISDKATEMLVEHARFLAQVSVTAAENLVLEFIGAVKSYVDFVVDCRQDYRWLL